MIQSCLVSVISTISRLTVLFVLWAACPVYAQIVTNNGALVTATNGSIMWVNGNYNTIGNGQSTFQGNALLQVNGSMTIQSGAMNLQDSSLAVATDSCVLDAAGEMHRLGTGLLSVYKMVSNKGTIENTGTIEVGRTALPTSIRQHVWNDVTGVITNKGMLRFLADNGKFANYQPDITKVDNSGGIIEFTGLNNLFTEGDYKVPFIGDNASTALGSRWNFRISGLVRYTHLLDTQRVQARYYTNLELDQSAVKLVPTDVYVGNTYSITPTSGKRFYSGTFHYDGSIPQSIYPEQGPSLVNRYYNLDLLVSDQSQSSTKSVDTNQIVRLDAVLTSAALAPLHVNGEMYLGNLGRDTSITFGTIDIRNKGIVEMGSRPAIVHADVTVSPGQFHSPKGAGDVTVASTAVMKLVATDGVLRLGEGTNLIVTGDFQNAGDGTNLTAHPTSTVFFNGKSGQQIEKTILTNGYGNVSTLLDKVSRGNVFMTGNLKVDSGNVQMNKDVLTMIDPRKSVTYVGGLEEVIGGFRHLAMPSGTGSFTFNNRNTTVTFATGSVVPQEMTFTVTPVASPANPPLQFSDITDANRRIIIDYSDTSDWEATIRAGYKVTEIGNQIDEAQLEFFETTPISAKNINTAQLNSSYKYTRQFSSASALGYVELPGIHPFKISSTLPDAAVFATGNDLLLRYGSEKPAAPILAHVLMEGPYRDGGMTYDLRKYNLIDSTPRDMTPYNLDPLRSLERIRTMPDSIVDWVTIEVRTLLSGGDKVYRNCLLRADGSLVDLDGKSAVKLPLTQNGDYYVVVRHRNHLAVMTAAPVPLKLSAPGIKDTLKLVDLSDERIVLGGVDALRAIARRPDNSIIYGMIGGDYNSDGVIDQRDYDRIWNWRDYEGYWNEDTDLSGIVTTRDYNLSWNNANMGRKTLVP